MRPSVKGSFTSIPASFAASAVDEALKQLQSGFRLLLLGHVPAILNEAQGGIGQRAPELQPDLERYDAVMVASKDQRR